MHIVHDFASFSNRQLSNLGGMIKEFIGANTDTKRLATKVLLRMGYHLGAGHGLSKEWRGGK